VINILTNNKSTEYKDVIRKLAHSVGEEVCVLEDTPQNVTRLFDGANYVNGRTILLRPTFIPLPSFFDELDYYYNQGVFVITPQAYRAVFNPGETTPYKMAPHGIGHDFAVIQVMGQSNYILPRGAHWDYLEKKECNAIYRIESRFYGDFEQGVSIRSSLGDIIPGTGKGGQITFLGRDGIGGDTTVCRNTQKRLARAAIEALRIWLK